MGACSLSCACLMLLTWRVCGTGAHAAAQCSTRSHPTRGQRESHGMMGCSWLLPRCVDLTSACMHACCLALQHLLVTDSFTTITRGEVHARQKLSSQSTLLIVSHVFPVCLPAALVIDDLALVPVINRLLATNKVLEQVNIFW